MRNYDRRIQDKENNFESSPYSGTNNSKTPFVSNGQLRRKFDENIALLERDQPKTTEEN